jgi:AbrB family looped-hinge helix DNA binding protein
MSELIAKVDSKGRVVIPEGLREDLGQVVVVKKTDEGILLRPVKGKPNNLERILDFEPRRTARPENPRPEEMKKIWNE